MDMPGPCMLILCQFTVIFLAKYAWANEFAGIALIDLLLPKIYITLVGRIK